MSLVVTTSFKALEILFSVLGIDPLDIVIKHLPINLQAWVGTIKSLIKFLKSKPSICNIVFAATKYIGGAIVINGGYFLLHYTWKTLRYVVVKFCSITGHLAKNCYRLLTAEAPQKPLAEPTPSRAKVVGSQTVMVYDDYYDTDKINKPELDIEVGLGTKKLPKTEEKDETEHSNSTPDLFESIASTDESNSAFNVLATENKNGEIGDVFKSDGATVIEIPLTKIHEFFSYVKNASNNVEPLESFLADYLPTKDKAEPTAPPAVFVDDDGLAQCLDGNNSNQNKSYQPMQIVQPLTVQHSDLTYLSESDQFTENQLQWVELKPLPL